MPHYHHKWYHGGWKGFHNWYFPFVWGLGWGWGYPYTDYGYNPWGYNSLAYNWGYWDYYNPYYVDHGSYPYDYTQPVVINYYGSTSPIYDTTSSSTTVTAITVDTATQDEFEAARTAFRNGEFETALRRIDRVIEETPSDPVAHELRALILFAMGRYADAAAGLNALLAVAPGWNWETMRELYPNVDTYTAQLRSLEGYVAEHPDDAAPHFVLAYHYLVTNYPDAAKEQLQRVVELQPRDRIAQQLLKGLTKEPTDESADTMAPAEDLATADDVPPEATTDLVGAWDAKSRQGSISVTLNDDGQFTWKAPVGDDVRTITGTYTLSSDVLVLEGEDGQTMVGRVVSLGEDRFRFKLMGGPAEDTGLEFSRIGVSARPSGNVREF